MGLHNLESRSLAEMMEDLTNALDASNRHPWLDSVLTQWGSSAAPFSTQAETVGHVHNGLRGLKFPFAKRCRRRHAKRGKPALNN